MLETIRQLIAYSGWANARLLAALRSTSRHHQKALHLLAHLLVSERIWLLRLKGQDTSAINKSPELLFAECEKLANENQKAYTGLLDSLSEDKLNSPVTYRNFKGTEFHTPVGEILMHVALHGTYHRGQIATAMRAEGGIPVDTDFITFVRERGGREVTSVTQQRHAADRE
jgi:uncharacterized damage-inducible protein DinB